ncbi:MAG TPA: DUF2807 domain-containing protein [Bacteroidetes bacterium]|nr:DUF2807 domain-containing protein [Bacteroidota bacterium]
MKTTYLFALVIVSNFLFSCTGESQNWFSSGVKGEGPKVTRTLDLSSFDALSLGIDAELYLSQGIQSVKIEGQQNILDLINTDVKDNKWKIRFSENVRNYEKIKIWVSIPHLTKAGVSGSGDIVGQTPFKNLDDLKLAVSGSGDIELDADSRSLEGAVSGSGRIHVDGNTGDCEFRISGSGDIDAYGLVSENCKVKISGSGDASVNVNNSLEVGIAGSGDVYYKGRPKVRSKISGSGDVQAN